MTTALTILQAALESYDNMIADTHGDTVSAYRDWSYIDWRSYKNRWRDSPDEHTVEEYSDTVSITFDGTAFIATCEGKEVAREVVEAWDNPEAGITAEDIKSHAAGMAETIADILPERDIAQEREEARGEYLIERYLERRGAV